MASRTPGRQARRQPRPRRRVAQESPLARALRDVCAELTQLGVGYALVGGLAVSARAEPRLRAMSTSRSLRETTKTPRI